VSKPAEPIAETILSPKIAMSGTWAEFREFMRGEENGRLFLRWNTRRMQEISKNHARVFYFLKIKVKA